MFHITFLVYMLGFREHKREKKMMKRRGKKKPTERRNRKKENQLFFFCVYGVHWSDSDVTLSLAPPSRATAFKACVESRILERKKKEDTQFLASVLDFGKDKSRDLLLRSLLSLFSHFQVQHFTPPPFVVNFPLPSYQPNVCVCVCMCMCWRLSVILPSCDIVFTTADLRTAFFFLPFTPGY